MIAGVRGMAAAAVLVLAVGAAWGQIVPPSEQPGRERQRFVDPPAPRAQPGGAAISLPSTVAPPGAANIMVRVRDVRVTGSTVFSADQLQPLYADLVGQRVPLQAVYDLAQKITNKYGAEGYILSRAIVPPQELSPGGAVVQLQVVEGYVDRVEWPRTLDRYRDFFSDYTTKILADRPANIRSLERYLLLASDLPGLKFKNSLKPSASKPGAATLVVEVEEKPVDLLGRIDNRGTKARGPLQFLTSITANNFLRAHDLFNFTYAGAFQTKELQYFSASYRQVLTSEGLAAFVNASYGFGRPTLPVLEEFGYKTRSTIVEFGLTYPFIRARERNLSVSALAFFTDDRGILGDQPEGIGSTHDRIPGVRVRIDADAADSTQAINQVNVVLSQGIHGLGSTDNGQELATRANGRVDFTKVEATATRLQPLVQNFSILTAAYGQFAFNPLLSSELCGYGGRALGRAYDPSELLADRCFIALGEMRFDIPHEIAALTQAQLYGYYDHGWLHNIAPVPGTPANQSAASAGAGLRLGVSNVFNVDLSAAKAVEGPRNDWRFFFIATARY